MSAFVVVTVTSPIPPSSRERSGSSPRRVVTGVHVGAMVVVVVVVGPARALVAHRAIAPSAKRPAKVIPGRFRAFAMSEWKNLDLSASNS